MKIYFDTTYHLDSLATVVAKIWELIKDEKVVAFKGEMGAGKTTFVSALAKHIGITDEVSSPTFSIINEYANTATHSKIYHLDLYRIDDITELMAIGIEDLIESEYEIMLIEWPQIATTLIPPNTKMITIEKTSFLERKITLSDYHSEV
jgi:tRNA threonylcarbamoyladenosine biosynthesis protein TsaE